MRHSRMRTGTVAQRARQVIEGTPVALLLSTSLSLPLAGCK